MKFFSTILDALNHHAVETPNKVVLTWVDIDCEEQNKLTFKQLEDQSNAVAARLLKLGCKKGDRVMVAYPFGLEFLAGMFGAMKIGVIPCSIYPPNPNQLKTDMPKFRGFAKDAGAKYALSTNMFATAMTAASVLFKTGVKWIGTDKLTIEKNKPNKPKDYETYNGESDDVCFIQYTSGSTGRPKGVMISHGNLAENCTALVQMTDVTPSSVAALWVPQYHGKFKTQGAYYYDWISHVCNPDMGLVAGFMSCLYGGFHLVLASPLDFVSRPLLWTAMIEHYQATHTCAPNFAYALLLKRLEQANRTANWSCVKRAMFGGEPAQDHVVEAAAKTLSIKPEHVYNIYGLAESVVFLTGGSVYPDSEGLVCCGEVDSPTLKLRIVQDGKEVEDGQVGSIWAQSPRVAAGYYGQPELTTSTFANVLPGRTTAFQHGEDSVGITVEGRKDFDKLGNEDLAVQISNHVSQVHGLLVSDVVVLKLGVTPKTTSGKLKRSERSGRPLLLTIGRNLLFSSWMSISWNFIFLGSLAWMKLGPKPPRQQLQCKKCAPKSCSILRTSTQPSANLPRLSVKILTGSADKDSSTWMASKLLLPCIIGDVNASFFYARTTSLYLVLQTIGRRTTSPKYYTQSILSRRALEIFGRLNLSWAQELGFSHPPLGSDKGMTLNEEDWLSLFDQWGSENQKSQTTNPNSDINASKAGAGATDPDDFSIRYDNIIMSVFGSHIDTSKTWAENGLTSLKSAELRNKVEEELHVALPANFEQLYPTPKVLSVHLSASEGKCFPKQDTDNHPDFHWNSSQSRISKLQLGVLQTLGAFVILFLVLVSIVPSYYLVSWVMDQCYSTEIGECNGSFFWILLPMMVPLFMLSFSTIVFLCKITITGKYLPRQFDLLSWDYVQWWFMDRLMDVWESLVGHFFVKTRFIWIFYWLLGADLAWTAKIESYIREFDLINVGSKATIGHSLKCRKFSYSRTAGGCPKMTFRPIAVGANCTISGMICPGAKIGDVSKVETLSVVEEGAIVPEGVLAQGKPAYNAGLFRHTESIDVEESMLDVFKMLWAIFEAYHLFTLAFVGSIVMQEILPSWRYGGILHWILLLPFTSILALCSSIALKWLLIGTRDPSDEFEGSLYNRATNWACDFHFHAAGFAVAPFCGASKIWNIIFFLHGLDIDLESRVNGLYAHFQPSKVDFVKIQKSFASAISLDLSKQEGVKIEVINSSVGYNANLHSGIKIMQSTIPPRSDASKSVYDLNQQSSHGLSKPSTVTLQTELLQVLLNVVLFSSIIPSYEVGLAASTSPSSAITLLGLITAFVLQWLVWILLTRAVEIILFKLPNHVQLSFFGVYINTVWVFRVGNLLEKLLYGTPMFGYYAKLMGAEVSGDLWYFGDEVYEYGKLHFKGDVLVDSSHLSGHYVDGNGLTLEDTHVSGLLHPGCYASAGSVVSAADHDPWKVFLRSDMGAKDSTNLPSDSTSNNVDTSDIV
ncbi:D-alanine--D-alanyl carrier protein ligase [Seminavis robusta]|uniref:D-alanine--D-alanyl carrier protein ligase n=1 Tax=Seminavis robusta TaxID=568900 RepID=A0A9N8DGJ8_9STRA|nr:D-alanine--D-alanyl carrier protein ligase [Seminavis robusta]|eukprot:Sro141_g065840.1 D-alanine--D-alanyl carrier protein ligase (1473) ;mRNA; f:55705-64028